MVSGPVVKAPTNPRRQGYLGLPTSLGGKCPGAVRELSEDYASAQRALDALWAELGELLE